MAMGLYFTPSSFTVAKYDDSTRKLEEAGAGSPPGRLYHVALETDGEIQVFHDIVGLFEWLKPRHTRRYAELGEEIRRAVGQYVTDVRAGQFPTAENSFHVPELKDLE